MKPIRYLLPAIAGAMLGLSAGQAAAQDAEFGCKILLCVASQNPSWQGVPYCVPPVMKLLAIRKVHPGYWPACPQAGTGKPGREEYEDCPAGSTPVNISAGTGGGDNGRERSIPGCAKPVQVACSSLIDRDEPGYYTRARRVADQLCSTTTTFPRAKRKDPYYFDIRNKETGKISRHYFNLRH
ncbi:hypothetical protein [Aminobacter sp. MET-1]|uniref:hypothetical protein n=1 Tax=Aminobacter sp. MET-1 TaxID=2951085 RepID=UPI00226A39E9|nr:hypothetical protein [Aminobacter sp. MET-1]MCX8571102.1 hypothetical protein [Aminobacter sp. MET-1]MCX8573229.1 hypothetical protein [Aminobacter sp. MET-1]